MSDITSKPMEEDELNEKSFGTKTEIKQRSYRASLHLGRKRKILLVLAITLGSISGIATGVILLRSMNPKTPAKTKVLSETTVIATPDPSPVTAKVNAPNWKTFISTDSGKRLRFDYPPDSKVLPVDGLSLLIISKNASASSLFTDDIITNVEISSKSTLFNSLISAQNEVQVKDPDNNTLITKIGERTVSAYSAVEYLAEPITGQAEERYVFGLIINSNNSFYHIFAVRSTADSLLDFIPVFEKIVNSFVFPQ